MSDPDLEITRIEIPHFQRDYAQGRESERVRQIRTDFLDVLFTAIGGDRPTPVGLDFVYGSVEDGTFRPLDGQQRLTTLFLVHWYIASRSGRLAEEHGWQRFSYATRPSARLFCERLVEHALPHDEAVPSKWIADQSWYLFLWRHDPTIQSMLVMVDAIHNRFRSVDPVTAWTRLMAVDEPAVWFLFQTLSGLGSADGQDMRPEDLYIKMNSRGKPLTEFENFKAHFEKTIESSPLSSEFAVQVDTTWSDLLWPFRGDNDLIDDEFLRYMEFVTEVCEWRDGRSDAAGKRLGTRTRDVFGDSNPQREAHLKFLFQAFNIWVDCSIPELFGRLFVTGDTQADASKVRLFFRSDGKSPEAVNLFDACCRSYGETRSKARVFSLGQGLILYAVVLYLIEDTTDFPRRVRILRNLIEASSDELRLRDMPEILEDVHCVIRDGALERVATLNQVQVEDEKLKETFIGENPQLLSALRELEDHEHLRGNFGAIELDAASFQGRAAAFHRVMSRPDLWPYLLGAMLAVGEYQLQSHNGRSFRFGTDSKKYDNAWRELLTGNDRSRLKPTRHVLAEFLDLVQSHPGELADTLNAIASGYLERCGSAERFDWRYYMVKYPSMREAGSSTYYAEPTDNSGGAAMGYSLCMLQAGGRALNGNYRDPFLLAIWRELGDSEAVEDKWFTGYETRPRRMPLTRSGAALRCVALGFELSPPETNEHSEAFEAVCAELGAVTGALAVPQVQVNGQLVDTIDRIQLGAHIVRRLVAAGL